MSSLFNRKPFRGGPDFDKISTLCFDLGGTRFDLTLPGTLHSVMETSRIRKNFPLQEDGWFDANCSHPFAHDFIQMYFGTWPYFTKGMDRIRSYLYRISQHPIGHINLGADLCRTESERTLDLRDPQSLRAYIEWEYNDYYETPAAGRGGFNRAHNYDVRQDCERSFPVVGRREHHGLQEQYESALEDRLIPMPQDFGMIDFAGEQWTHFALGKGMNITRYFCLPLSEYYYLRISLSVGIDYFGWKIENILAADMRRSTDWILQNIKITFPGKPAGSLALPQ